MKVTRKSLALGFACLMSVASVVCGQSDEPKFELAIKHRINAHGDEFNQLVKSPDGQRAYIGTEKSDVLVWNLAAGRLERTLHQLSPVHHLLALGSDTVFAAGSNHHEPLQPLVRRWNVITGTFIDLPGLASDSVPTAAAIDGASGLVAVGLSDGKVLVWETSENKAVSQWNVNEIPFGIAIVNRDVYVVGVTREAIRSERLSDNAILHFNVDKAGAKPDEFYRKAGRSWERVDSSPDGKSLVAGYQEAYRSHTVLIDLVARTELPVTGSRELAWIDSHTLLRFENFDPAEVLRLNDRSVNSVRKFPRMQNDRDGRAFDQTGQIVNAQATRAWAVYRMGPGFLEFDLVNAKIKTLIDGPSGAYAISVDTKDGNEGTLATGGADGYVRLWKLSDLSLLKEYHVAASDEGVNDVVLTANAQQAVVGVIKAAKTLEERFKSPLQVVLLNLADGATRKLFDMSPWQGRFSVVDDLILYPSGDRMQLYPISGTQAVRAFAVGKPIIKQVISNNKKSLAVLDSEQVLSVFEVATGKKLASHPIKASEYGPLAVTGDGRYVYQVTNQGQLLAWNTETGQMSEHTLKRLKETFTSVDFARLANDDRWIITAGNHGDVGIFETGTGDLVCYQQSHAAAFYAEAAWLMGDRLLFTTDAGVLFDGRLIAPGKK